MTFIHATKPPGPVAARLKVKTEVIADSYAEVSVLFADIVNFTPLAALLTAEEVVNLLNRVFSRFDELAEKHGLEKIKTIGDAYMVVGGLTDPAGASATAIFAMAQDMQAAIATFTRPDGTPLRLRIGINTGPVVAGIIGTKKFLYDLWGDTVNVASRMESQGAAGEIMVTEATYNRLANRPEWRQSFELIVVEVKGRGSIRAYVWSGAT